MHQALVKIIHDRVLSQFDNEEQFCSEYMEISISKWEEWKIGNLALHPEEMQKIKSLFSDYEWMLLQKMIRQTVLFPEKRNYVVIEYKRVKTLIAKKWIQSGEAIVELISQKNSSKKERHVRGYHKETINLKISLEYGAWGYDDILEFRLPAVIQKQIDDSPVDLLEWVSENLTDTYLSGETEE